MSSILNSIFWCSKNISSFLVLLLLNHLGQDSSFCCPLSCGRKDSWTEYVRIAATTCPLVAWGSCPKSCIPRYHYIWSSGLFWEWLFISHLWPDHLWNVPPVHIFLQLSHLKAHLKVCLAFSMQTSSSSSPWSQEPSTQWSNFLGGRSVWHKGVRDRPVKGVRGCLMNELEYQAVKITHRPVVIGQPLRVSEQGSDQWPGHSFIQQIIIDICCV